MATTFDFTAFSLRFLRATPFLSLFDWFVWLYVYLCVVTIITFQIVSHFNIFGGLGL